MVANGRSGESPFVDASLAVLKVEPTKYRSPVDIV
jgi:hypothetical protein